MRIQEVSKLFDIPSPTLRYYEELGLIEDVPRVSNQRDYNQKHIDQIKFIICMKQTGLSLEEIQHYINLYLTDSETRKQCIPILEKQKSATLEKIQQLEQIITYLNHKIVDIEKEK